MWYYIFINFMAFCRLEAVTLPQTSVSGSRAAKFDARRRQPSPTAADFRAKNETAERIFRFHSASGSRQNASALNQRKFILAPAPGRQKQHRRNHLWQRNSKEQLLFALRS
jgi:hypothetical protein